METVFLWLGAVLALGGVIATLWLEFGSSEQRRLVPRLRDGFEVVLPPLLVVALVWAVIVMRDSSGG